MFFLQIAASGIPQMSEFCGLQKTQES
jgi:hypothetical protein